MTLRRTPQIAGETTITGKNQVSLPSKSIRELGWERGDRLIVEILGGDMLVLVRHPAHWTQAFAGRLTDVFGTHEETIQWLDRERNSWHAEESGEGGRAG
ncbi:MAG: AbrB/MazE/SpoVT family DNA-binding domain-containing protein [Dehalococcoidia bacterium]|nr:AbrB/MazE/SpoVT family DNA-binding domain-containing protein [Dehalococcoidia bacterium]